MHASIMGILAEKVMCLGFDSAHRLYTDANQIDFAAMGRERRALFITVSDLDRSLDPLTNLLVTQAFAGLIRHADTQPDGRLATPVRFMLDDFANLQMPQIDNVLSIIRSREIWATLLLQSTNQLDALYGEARARSIMGNCDTQLVLAFQDPESARVFSERADVPPSTLMATPVDRSWLFVAAALPSRSSALGSRTTRSTQSSPKPKALRTNSTSDDVTRPIESDRQQKRGPYPNGYGPLSAKCQF